MSARALRVVAAVSAACGLASLIAFAFAALRPAPAVAVDDARADSRSAVRLEGGRWICEAIVPASARLTADDGAAWIPRAGDRRLVLVATREPAICPPAEDAGVVSAVVERSYEALRDRDPLLFGALAQRDVLLFFPGARPRVDRGLLYAGASLVFVSYAMLARSRRA